MSATVSSEERNAFYQAAYLGLRALDAAERTPRRFGSDADARWRSFQGHLGLSDRLNLLIRDAAVTWTSGFSPAIVFGLSGLASDEPFGPDWTALAEHEAKQLWSDSSRPILALLLEMLEIATGDVDLPRVSAATQLVVAGGVATRAVADHFAAHRELSWSDQVLVVASGPAVRQCAGLVAAVRLEFPILSLNAGRRQRCVPPIVCPTLSRVWKLSCSPCSTWPSRPQSSVGPAACEP